MIADHQTNTVYLADVMHEEFSPEVRELKNIISRADYKVKFLKGTSDHYCRDYMPVQVDKSDFVQIVFRLAKFYKKRELDLISKPIRIEIENKLIQPRYSNIILDGSNVVKWTDKVITTKKVIEDNTYQFPSEEAILEQLERELNCEVILIQPYPGDLTGLMQMGLYVLSMPITFL